MKYRQVIVPAAVGIFALTAVAFGPLVSGVSLESEPAPVITNEGELTIESVTFPTEVTVSSGSYGAANAYLRVPPATVRFDSITGNPTLVYELRIDQLNYSFSSSHFLDAGDHGPTYDATVAPMSVDDSRFEKQRYPGVLTIGVRNSTGLRVAASRNITVRVAE